MTETRGIYFYTEEFQHYDMGHGHPLKPIRLKRTHDLLAEYGALEAVTVRRPTLCSIEDLRTCHSEEYIRAVDFLSESPTFPHSYRRFGFGSGDNPVFHGMFEASRLYTGASADAAQAIVEGECRVAMNLSGGLHHAHYGSAAGFCVFNDAAVAIHRLRTRFAKVAYIDIDVHHGDGVQELFYSDPSVLTVSIHQSGQTLFPGTGFVGEIGEGEGRGFSVNVPVWPETTDEVWLGAWRRAAVPILNAFAPEAVVLQMGADPHYLDPLAHVALTAQGWLEAVKDVNALGVPIVALGGGGYNQATVPRMWTLAYAELFGLSLPDETPETYYYHAQIPRLSDPEQPPIGARQVEEAARYADYTVTEVERTLFPYHDL